MIRIENKEDCCGCAACVQICPKKCFSLLEDEQGFLYPLGNNNICIECGLCERVCPIINKWETKQPIQIKASKNKNDFERNASSSGGIFVLLAKKTIATGNGVVFGACFDDDWSVKHGYTETLDGILAFQGSKYIQSKIGDTYIKAKDFLDQGRNVLFSGTPCQIAGLKHYLRKDYNNLVTIEILCHGVPSQRVWRDYLKFVLHSDGKSGDGNTFSSTLKDSSAIESISFRDKKNGWRKFGFVLRFRDERSDNRKGEQDINECYAKNLFMKGFLKNLYIRPSCFNCHSKGGSSKADLSLGDFWTVDKHCPTFNDNKGVSLVYVNSERGRNVLNGLDIDVIELKKEIQYNRMYSKSCIEKYPLDLFWRRYEKEGLKSIIAIVKSMRKPLLLRILNKLLRCFSLNSNEEVGISVL